MVSYLTLTAEFMMASSIACKVTATLRPYAEPEKARKLPQFFQSFPGGYGEGDRFLGVRVPHVRRVAGQFYGMTLGEISELLASPWHEVRLCALVILVDAYRNAPDRESCVAFYLAHLRHVDNWDLVDASAYHILGDYLLEHPDPALLERLAQSGNLWERRVAVVATLAFIRAGILGPTFALAQRLLSDPHSLIHKAVGWMLREAGKRDATMLRAFLDEHASEMPRTMLRYALEKMEKSVREGYMKRGRSEA